MLKQVTVTDLQRRAAEVSSGLREGPVAISQRGRLAAVILAAEAYERMEQALAEVEAKQVRALAAGLAPFSQRGRHVPELQDRPEQGIVREVTLPRRARVFYLFVPDSEELTIPGLLPRGGVFRSCVLGPRFEQD